METAVLPAPGSERRVYGVLKFAFISTDLSNSKTFKSLVSTFSAFLPLSSNSKQKVFDKKKLFNL
jgi:hypothetical protein